ncbi:unnamed protein product [Trichobilharzia regenti]|nr:unnamed protein product [Trichobilharzia regenti]
MDPAKVVEALSSTLSADKQENGTKVLNEIRTHLKVALSKIIKYDFPMRFQEFPEQVKHFILSNDQHHMRGALTCLYAFVDTYAYQKNDVRQHVVATMQVFFPILFSTVSNLIAEESEDSYILQTLIAKTFFSFIQYHFPLDAMDKESQLESFLVGHVLPTLHAPEGYRRARAYRLLEKLSEAKFNDQNIFAQVVDEVRKAACFDSELPVRAFAALCLAELVRSQKTGKFVC